MDNAQQAPQAPQGEYLTPIPREVGQSITMSFPDAMREVIKGNKVRRISWETQSDHGLLKDEFLSIHTKGAYHTWLVSQSDMEGQDWIIMKDINATN